MFRVLEDTVLRRAAAITLVALTTSLAACGSEDVGDAAAPAGSTPPAVVASTPPTKAPKAAAEPRTESKATAKATADKMSQVEAALKAAGFKPSASEVSSGAEGTIQVNNIAVVFYPSKAKAKEAADLFGKAIKSNPGYGAIAQQGARVYVLSSATKVGDKERAEFAKVQEIAGDAL